MRRLTITAKRMVKSLPSPRRRIYQSLKMMAEKIEKSAIVSQVRNLHEDKTGMHLIVVVKG